MASTDARVIPYKNAAYRATFPILDADGDLVTGATSLDSEISKDGGTFTDCTNEATEIATSSGMYYLDLTSTEMNADTVAIIVKSGNGKTTPIVLYPQETGDVRVDVQSISGDATAADNAEAFFDGTGYAGTGNTIPTVTTLTGHTAQTGDAYAIVNSVTHGNAALKALIDAVDDFVDTEVAAILAAVDTEIGNIQSRLPAALVGGRMDSSLGAAAADTLTASALATDAVTEIVNAVKAIAVVHSVGDPVTLDEMLGLIKESIKNKLNVVKATGVMTLYKNDGTTARFAHTLVDDATNATRGAGV